MLETTSQKRQRFIKKWVKELSDKLSKPTDDLLSDGLMADDFGSHNVFIEYEDGSSSHFKNAFFVENDKEYGIFTEHCDYHEFNKEWLNKIEEEATFYIDKLVKVKWAGGGVAYIECDNERLYLNKLQLKSLEQELGGFIRYYDKDFSHRELRMFRNSSDEEN